MMSGFIVWLANPDNIYPAHFSTRLNSSVQYSRFT